MERKSLNMNIRKKMKKQKRSRKPGWGEQRVAFIKREKRGELREEGKTCRRSRTPGKNTTLILGRASQIKVSRGARLRELKRSRGRQSDVAEREKV